MKLSLSVLLALALGLDLPSVHAESDAMPVALLTLEAQQQYSQTHTFVGRVEANRIGNLGFELGGVLKTVYKDEGDSVARGDVVALLDTQKLQARRTEIQADIRRAEAGLRLAEATLKRQQDIAKQQLAAHQTLDEAREARDSARARLAQAKASLKVIDVDLSKAELKAPFGGTVIRRHHDEGDVIAVGRSILQIQEDAPYQARIGIANHLSDGFQVGQNVTLSIYKQAVPARIKAVLPVRNRSVRTVDMLFELPPDSKVRPGDLVAWALEQEVEAVGYWVPLTALTEGERGLWGVYVLNPASQTAQLRMVELLHQTAERAYVRGLVQAGEQIVSKGTQRIVPEQRIRLAQVDR